MAVNWIKQIKRKPFFDVREYGATGDGETDDTSAINSAIAVAIAAGGGTVLFPAGEYLCNSQLSLPVTGSGPATIVPLRFVGTGAACPGGDDHIPTGGTVIKVGYEGSGSFITALGAGSLEITGIMFQAVSTSSFSFIYATNTVLWVHNCTFLGHETFENETCIQDAIVLGGTLAAIGDTPDHGFQGYGTTITQNYFDRIRRAVLVRTWGNAIQITDNTIMVRSGTNISGGAAIEFDGGPEPNYGCWVAGNLIEVHGYYYGIKLTNARQHVIIGNGFWDEQAITIAGVHFTSTATGNLLISGFLGNTKPLFDDDSGGANSYISTVDGIIGMASAGDFKNRLSIKSGTTSTSAFNDQGSAPVIVTQTNATNGNWTGINFSDAADTIAGGFAVRLVNHSTHLGEPSISCRSTAYGFSERMRFIDSGHIWQRVGPSAPSNDDLPIGCMTFHVNEGTNTLTITYKRSTDGTVVNADIALT